MVLWVLLLSLAEGLPFIATWKTTIVNEAINLPSFIVLSSLDIVWGDGSGLTSLGQGNASQISHTYGAAGLYNVSFIGDMSGFRFNAQGDAAKLTQIVSWGNGFRVDSTNVFAGCVNLQTLPPATSQPVLSTLEGIFMSTGVNSPLAWDLSNVTSLVSMFAFATSFNQSIAFTNTQGVTTMASMFNGASKFNQPVNIDTRNVQVMTALFAGAVSFNQSISFNTSSLILADDFLNGALAFNSPVNFTTTAALTNTARMFSSAIAFNQPITFQTPNVIGMEQMFENAASFNQLLTFNTSKVRGMTSMFSGAISFNKPVNFVTTSLTVADAMFNNASAFNSTVTFTSTPALLNIAGMFAGAVAFNQPITFPTGTVLYMNDLFHSATSFNQPLTLNTSSTTNMGHMFHSASSFNQSVDFDVRKVTEMTSMFAFATNFNRPLLFQNTSNVLLMERMFEGAVNFNQPINFRADKLVSTNFMFRNATNFNQPVVLVNSTRMTILSGMFYGAVNFNATVTLNSTSQATDMSYMFLGALGFQQNLSNFNTSLVVSCTEFCYRCGLPQFPLCTPCKGPRLTSVMNLSVCNCPLNETNISATQCGATTQAPTSPPSPTPPTPAPIATPTTAPTPIPTSTSAPSTSAPTTPTTPSSPTNSPTTVTSIPTPAPTSAPTAANGNTTLSPSTQSPTHALNGSTVSPSTPTINPNALHRSSAPTTTSPTTPTTTAPTVLTTSPTTASPTKMPTNAPHALTNVPTLETNVVSPTPCALAQVTAGLQVECISGTPTAPTPASSPTPKPGMIFLSPLYNITQADSNSSTFVFILPIDAQLFKEMGKISQPCAEQAVRCEWQDPNTLEFRHSGCSVSNSKVDMGSGVVGTECTCTHLTVFAIVMRSDLSLVPLCHAQDVDYVLIALYAVLSVCLVVQITRIIRYKLSGVSLTQHSLLVVVCILRIVYLVAKPVIQSLAELVLLGLFPSALALSLFIHVLLAWASLKNATFDASPFDRFRVPFIIVTVLVFLLVIAISVLVAAVGTESPDTQIEIVSGGSYVLATLYAVVCVLVLFSGIGLRQAISSDSAMRATDWRTVFRHRILITTLLLSGCLFLVACLWVAAVQADIVTSSAATLATSTCFYVFDWLSLCVLTWLFSKSITDVAKRPIRRSRHTTQTDGVQLSDMSTSH